MRYFVVIVCFSWFPTFVETFVLSDNQLCLCTQAYIPLGLWTESSSTEYQISLWPPDQHGKPTVKPRTLEETKLQDLLPPDKAG